MQIISGVYGYDDWDVDEVKSNDKNYDELDDILMMLSC